MCACTTSECKRAVRDDLAAWSKTASGVLLSRTPKNEISEAQRAQIDPIEAELERCRR